MEREMSTPPTLHTAAWPTLPFYLDQLFPKLPKQPQILVMCSTINELSPVTSKMTIIWIDISLCSMTPELCAWISFSSRLFHESSNTVTGYNIRHSLSWQFSREIWNLQVSIGYIVHRPPFACEWACIITLTSASLGLHVWSVSRAIKAFRSSLRWIISTPSMLQFIMPRWPVIHSTERLNKQ